MAPTFVLDPLLLTPGLDGEDVGGVELERETVGGSLGVASGSLPAAFARSGSN